MNDFCQKISNISSVPDDPILCTVDIVGLYANIPHKWCLIAMKNVLDPIKDKAISAESLIKSAKKLKSLSTKICL